MAYEDVRDVEGRRRLEAWCQEIAANLDVAPKIIHALDGIVFEIRQGYKSKDSKRQNADINNIVSAYARGYLPVFVILSSQIDGDLAARYRNSKCPVLVGSLAPSPHTSTYAFCREIVGYDLAGFFERHSGALRQAIESIITALLTPQ